MVIAVIVWGFYSLIVRQYANILPEYSTFALAVAGGMIFLFPFFTWELFYVQKEIIWSVSAISAILYAEIFPSLVAILAWNSAVAQLGPVKAGIFLNLNPLFATIFAILFIGEKLAWYQFTGAMLVVLGVYVFTKVSSQRSPKHSPATNIPESASLHK